MHNWFEHIQNNIRSQPETLALVTEHRVFTYGMLGAGIEACARRVMAQRFPADALVAISVRDPIIHLTLSLALFRIGQPSITLDPAYRGKTGVSIAAILGDAVTKQQFAQADRFVEVTDDWFAAAPAAGSNLPEPFSRPDEICRYSLTSGTTGEPKIIGNTVDYFGRYVVPGIAVLECRFVLSILGLAGSWGFKIACAALASRKTVCFAISSYQAVRMIELFSIDVLFASPDQIISIVRVLRKTRGHVRSLRSVVIGGGIPTRAMLEGAAVHLCTDIYCRYGSSEVGFLAEAAAPEVLANPGFVGYVQPGFEVAVFTPHGEVCPPGEVGIVKARAKPAGGGEPNPWTDHGDRGWVTSDGRIFIVGRTSEILDAEAQAAGDISPIHEIEHLVRLELDADDAAAVVIDNGSAEKDPEVWVGTVKCEDARPEPLERVLYNHGIRARLRLVPITAVPRGASGKIQRGLLKELLGQQMNPR